MRSTCCLLSPARSRTLKFVVAQQCFALFSATTQLLVLSLAARRVHGSHQVSGEQHASLDVEEDRNRNAVWPVKVMELSLLLRRTAITVTTAEWAPGIWAGAEKMPIEVRDATGATVRGQANVASVNMDTRVVTTDVAIPGVISTDVIWHLGAYGNEFVGIHKILTQTTGTLFNINVATYNLFQGNQYSAASGALSFAKLNLAVSRGVEKGLEGKLSAFVNPRAWANMCSDQAALRRYDGSWSKKKLENGTEALSFYAQNGEIEIIPSIYVKEGYAYMLLSMEDFSSSRQSGHFLQPSWPRRSFLPRSRQLGRLRASLLHRPSGVLLVPQAIRSSSLAS
jgi:hypothetical protein